MSCNSIPLIRACHSSLTIVAQRLSRPHPSRCSQQMFRQPRRHLTRSLGIPHLQNIWNFLHDHRSRSAHKGFARGGACSTSQHFVISASTVENTSRILLVFCSALWSLTSVLILLLLMEHDSVQVVLRTWHAILTRAQSERCHCVATSR